jgi:hypothetical protein
MIRSINLNVINSPSFNTIININSSEKNNNTMANNYIELLISALELIKI